MELAPLHGAKIRPRPADGSGKWYTLVHGTMLEQQERNFTEMLHFSGSRFFMSTLRNSAKCGSN